MSRSQLQPGPATDHYHDALGPDQTPGGSLTVTDTVTSVAASSLQLPSGMVNDAGGGVAVVLPCVISDTDPGAIGAGGLWLQTDASGQYNANHATFQIYVRNADNDNWLQGPPGIDLSLNASHTQRVVLAVDLDNGLDTGLVVTPTGSNMHAQDVDGNAYAQVTTNVNGWEIHWSGPAPDYHYAVIAAFNGAGIDIATDGAPITMNGLPLGTQAAHVADGSTVDQLRDALIASGLMAAS